MNYYFYRQLFEGKRDDQLQPYVDICRKHGIDMTISGLKQKMLNKLRTEASMDSISLQSNFYLVGAVKYYFNGDLTTNKRLNILYPQYEDRFKPDVCSKLNRIILILRNAYIDSVGTKWAQPEDFGKLTIDKLFKKYERTLEKIYGDKETPTGKETKKVSPLEYKSGNGTGGYSMEVILQHNQCIKYNALTSPGAWCITFNNPGNYNNYTRGNKSHFIIFKKRRCDNIPYKPGNGFPKDKYGLSMLAVQQSNVDGQFICCTTRWNHGGYNGVPSIPNADFVYRDEDTFCNETGIPHEMLAKAFEAYKENKRLLNAETNADRSKDAAERAAERRDIIRKFKYAQMMINGGKALSQIFTNPNDGKEDPQYCRCVVGNGKVNKSVYLVKIEHLGETIGTLCVRGKLIYDQMLFRDHIQRIGCLSEDTWYNKRENTKNPNILMIDMGYYSGRVLFDLRRNKIITVAGKKKFENAQTIEYEGKYTDFVYVMINSRRSGIYDCRRGKAINVDNIEAFYDIVYDKGWQKNVRYGLPKNAILKVKVSDSWQDDWNERYQYYDLERGVKIDKPDTETLANLVNSEGNVLDADSRSRLVKPGGEINKINNKYYIIYNISVDGGGNIAQCVFDPSINDFAQICGHKVFKFIRPQNKVIYFRTMDGTPNLADLTRGYISGPLMKWLSNPNTDINLDDGFWHHDENVVRIRFYNSRSLDVRLLYNIKFGHYVKINNEIRFQNIEESSDGDREHEWKIYPLGYNSEGEDNGAFYLYNSETGDIEERGSNKRPKTNQFRFSEDEKNKLRGL